MLQLSGVSAPRLLFDEIAHSELARFSSGLNSAFNQNAIDRGLDRLIANPRRNTSGKLLAKRLLRDGQKHLRQTLNREFLDDKIETENRSFDLPTELDLLEIEQAVEIIRTCLMSLTGRERQVLNAKVQSSLPETLGVGERWFRTLLLNARNRLSQQLAVEDARVVVMNGISKWRWETIDLLKPLLDSLENAN